MNSLNMRIKSMKYVFFAVSQCWTLNCLKKKTKQNKTKQKQHCFLSFVFWQIVMMWVVTWFKLVFQQGMFIIPKLCPPSSNSPQFEITDFWVACLDWQSINWENCSDVRKGEWIIRIQANASSKSIIFKFQT